MLAIHRESWILLALTLADGDSLTLSELVTRLGEVVLRCPDEVGPDFYAPGDTEAIREDCTSLAARALVEQVDALDACGPRYATTAEGLRAAMLVGGEASQEALRCLGG